MCYIIFSGASYTSDSSKSPSYAIVKKDESIQLSTVMIGDYYSNLTSNNYTNINRYLEDGIINTDKEKEYLKQELKKVLQN